MKKINERNVIIFDLDGTLIDSSEGIICSINFAFKDQKIQPTKIPSKNIIGPPLTKTIEMIYGNGNPEKVNSLIKSFKRHYDSVGYLETQVFEGILELLEQLDNLNYEMFIVTNKRKIPTQKIIKNLSWEKYFSEVLSSDSFGGCLKTKSEVLKKLIDKHSLPIEKVIYIGDTQDDQLATIDANIDFIFAEWGYGNIANNMANQIASDPKVLFEMITEI